jgi:hypothetical protein
MRRVLTLLLLLALSASCARTSASKERYEKDGLGFSYTSDWHVRSDKEVSGTVGTRILMLVGPHEALLTLTRFPASHPTTLAEYVATVEGKRVAAVAKLSGSAARIEGKQLGVVRATIAGQAREGLAQAFDIDNAGVSTPYRADFYVIEAGDFKWMLMAQEQAAYEAALLPEIQLVYDSLTLPSAQARKDAAGAENK